MLSIQGVAVPQSKDICSLPIVRPVPRCLHTLKDVSYVRRMPVEVVSDILGLTSSSSHDPISQSISLSHVCKQWRQISLSTPCLWTFIYLSLPLSTSKLTRTLTWLTRSRNHPLNIYMDFRNPSWDWNETPHVFGSKAMDNIMHFLVPHAQRWRSIELLTDTWAPIFAFLSYTLTIESAPLLQTVRLARCNEYFVAPGEPFRPTHLARPIAWFRGGASLSHLRHVSLSGVHVDWSQSGLAGLRELELKYHARDVMPTLPEFRRLLCANAALERLVILGWGPQTACTSEHEDVDDVHTVTLPHLKELELGFVDVAYAIDLLSLFALPSLCVLSLEDLAAGIQLREQDCSRLFDHLVELSASKRESPCMPLSRLRALSLRSIHAEELSVHRLISHLCGMTSLCLDRLDATPLLAICLAVRGCERLQVMTLKNTGAAAAARALSSHSFPHRLRIFLDIDDDAEHDQEEEGVDEPDSGRMMASF